jgi:hypothetical protein
MPHLGVSAFASPPNLSARSLAYYSFATRRGKKGHADLEEDPDENDC